MTHNLSENFEDTLRDLKNLSNNFIKEFDVKVCVCSIDKWEFRSNFVGGT